jgi:hypothetical protein
MKTGAGMSEIERLRDQVANCHRLARMSGDAEIERRLIALAHEFEGKAVRAGAQANFVPSRLSQIAEDTDERRKLALTNFVKSW